MASLDTIGCAIASVFFFNAICHGLLWRQGHLLHLDMAEFHICTSVGRFKNDLKKGWMFLSSSPEFLMLACEMSEMHSRKTLDK